MKHEEIVPDVSIYMNFCSETQINDCITSIMEIYGNLFVHIDAFETKAGKSPLKQKRVNLR